MIPEFTKRGVKLIALSCDDVDTHKGWMEDIKAFIKTDLMDFPYPIIADQGRELAVKLGMVDPDEKDAQGMPLTCRAVSVLTVFPAKDCSLPMDPHERGAYQFQNAQRSELH